MPSFGKAKNYSMPQDPHQPAADDQAPGKPCEGFQAVAQHFARLAPLCNTENNRGQQHEDQRCAEVGKFKFGHQSFLPMAIWCASTALITLSSPATMMNLVP